MSENLVNKILTSAFLPDHSPLFSISSSISNSSKLCSFVPEAAMRWLTGRCDGRHLDDQSKQPPQALLHLDWLAATSLSLLPRTRPD
jgi:hypothetical protein